MPRRQSVDIVFVGYDANRTGAALMLLNFIRWIRQNTPWTFAILLQHGGALLNEYKELAETHVLTGDFTQFGRFGRRIEPLRGAWRLATAIQRIRIPRVAARLSPRLIYVNSSAAGTLLRLLPKTDAPVISHIHELETLRALLPDAHDFSYVVSRTKEFISVSAAVKQDLRTFHSIPEEQVTTIHGFIDASRFCTQHSDYDEARQRTRKMLGIPLDAFVVAGIGALNWTKAPDVLLQVARLIASRKLRRPIHFLWIGFPAEPGVTIRITHDLTKLNVGRIFQLVPGQTDVVPFFWSIDALALTSREDAYPLVVVEAGAASKPTICFADAGGAPEFVGSECGFVEPYLNIEAIANRIVQLSEDSTLAASLGSNAARKSKLHHNIDTTAPKVRDIISKYL